VLINTVVKEQPFDAYLLRPTLFETGILILGETAGFAKGAHLAVGADGGSGGEMELGFRAQLAGGV